MTDEQISTGFYWSYPGKAGLSIGLRYIDSKRFLNKTSDSVALSEKSQVSSGKGNRISVDYRFWKYKIFILILTFNQVVRGSSPHRPTSIWNDLLQIQSLLLNNCCNNVALTGKLLLTFQSRFLQKFLKYFQPNSESFKAWNFKSVIRIIHIW